MKRLMGLRRLVSLFSNSSEPPDLDQVWRDFLAHVRSILGLKNKKKTNESDPFFSGQPHKNFAFSFFFVFFVFSIFWLLTGVYVVGVSQQAIELRFGRYTQTTFPGLHWHWPFPIESRETYDVTNVRTVQIGYKNLPDSIEKKEATILTDDENIINIQFSVQYVVQDVKLFAFNNNGSPDDWVKQAAESAMREVVGRHVMDYVLYEGRADISDRCQELIQSILDRYQTGIRIVKVNLQNVQPPEAVQDAFSDAVKAVQDRERQKNEGQAYANAIIPNAEGKAARIVENAQAYAKRVVDVAEGDSRRFDQILFEYKKNPQIMRDRLYLDTFGHILEKSSKIYIDGHGGQNVFYLPLDQILNRKGGGGNDKKVFLSSQSDSSQGDIPPSTKKDYSPLENLEGKDFFRDRERGRR